MDFRTLIQDIEASGGEPFAQLRRASERSREVAAIADSLLDHFIQKARGEGLTWTQIGEALDISKQAAQQRSAKLIRALDPREAPAPEAAPSEHRRFRAGRKRLPMFARFTDRARLAVSEAEAVARGFGHDYVGTEHLLAGVVRAGRVGTEALAALGVDAHVIGQAIEAKIGRGSGDGFDPTRKVPFTPRAKRALEGALREALKLGHSYIGTEHIALTLMEGDQRSVARQILAEAGVEAETLRARIVEILDARRDT